MAFLAVMAMLLLVATPLWATESEIKAQPAKADDTGAETPEADASGEVPQPEEPRQSATAVCIDADEGQTSSVNTLEDIYSLSHGNVAALLQLTAAPAAEEKPAPVEVRWTEVKKD